MRDVGFSYLLHPSKKHSVQELCSCALESKFTALKEPKHKRAHWDNSKAPEHLQGVLPISNNNSAYTNVPLIQMSFRRITLQM